MPRSNGPYKVVMAIPEHSEYTLHFPNDKRHTFLRFHTNLLKQRIPNDLALFPDQEYMRPGPVMTKDGVTDHHIIDKIIDKQ
ncbi:hypothetical protein J132_11377 [Termitomyces sp. J132]|nr:hypothetical protein J132_11377 [Termitomyces sp. J132]